MSAKKGYWWVGLSSIGLICLVSGVLQKDYAILGKDSDSTAPLERSSESSIESNNSLETQSSSEESSTSNDTTIPTDSKITDSSSSTSSSSTSSETNVTIPKPPVTSSEEHKAPPVEQPEETQPLQEHLPAKADEQDIENNYQGAVSKHQSTQNFIDVVKDSAQEVAWKNDLYASVMLAQAILETGSGNSALSRAPYHNLFGIKGSYKGKSVSFATQEQLASGQAYTIQAKFRRYPDFKASFSDYAVLLKGGIEGNPTFYQKTWKSTTNNYKEATAFLTGRYATDTQYDKKLNDLIEVYELTQYDQKPGTKTKKTGYSQYPRIVNRIEDPVLLTEADKEATLQIEKEVAQSSTKIGKAKKEKQKQHKKTKKTSVMDQQVKDISGNQKVQSKKGTLTNE